MNRTRTQVLDRREQNLNIFRRPEGDKILWQPRIDFWLSVNRIEQTLPAHYRDMDRLEFYDDLDCSPRSYETFNPCMRFGFEKTKFEHIVAEDGIHKLSRWQTPLGTLELHMTHTHKNFHIDKFPVQSIEDFKVLEYILRDQVFGWDRDVFEQADRDLGDRAAPVVFIPRVNVMRLMLDWLGVEPTMFALMNEPEKVEHIIRVIDETDDAMIDMLTGTPIPIINYGDNLDCNLAPPPYIERYILPAYERRSKRLHEAGKIIFAHLDGGLKSMLPYIRRMPLDGVEAVTPLPQGDVTVEAIREAVPDGMAVLDGLPMTHFLPGTPIEELDACFDKVCELFAPKLILGISDEISPVCDIERVRHISRRVAEFNASL